MRRVYLILAIIGLVVPYYFLLMFLLENGLDLALGIGQLFANTISTFFAVDLIITAVVFWVFLFQETARYRIPRRWLYVVLTLAVGPSFALPLFLYARESRLVLKPS